MDWKYIFPTAVEFWNSNINAILITLIGGFIFFILGPIGVWFSGRKIKSERVCKAREMLLDVVEGMLVAQEQITPQKLKAIYNAIQRDVGVDIGSGYDFERIFEDMIFRFERSKHLDKDQKENYTSRIVEISAALDSESDQEMARGIPRAYEKIFRDLRDALEKSDKNIALKNVDELEHRLIDRSLGTDGVLPVSRIYQSYVRVAREHPRLFIGSTTIFLVVYVWVIVKFVFQH